MNLPVALSGVWCPLRLYTKTYFDDEYVRKKEFTKIPTFSLYLNIAPLALLSSDSLYLKYRPICWCLAFLLSLETFLVSNIELFAFFSFGGFEGFKNNQKYM